MEPLFEKTFLVRSYEVDQAGRVRPTALLNYMQEVAGDHCRLLHVAVHDLMPLGLTWVLSRTHLRIFQAVHSREELQVRTWPATIERRFSCREFEMMAADGSHVAVATCSFAVLDLASRRPVLISERLPHYPILERRALNDDFESLPRLERPERELTFRVGRGELDINRHANNVVYAAWGLETVPEGIAGECMLTDLEISYRAEAFFGETVLARCGELQGGNEPVFLHQLCRREDGVELSRLVTRWRKGTITSPAAFHDSLAAS